MKSGALQILSLKIALDDPERELSPHRFYGPLIRGRLGRALHSISQLTDDCSHNNKRLNSDCAYCYIFEQKSIDKFELAPHPFNLITPKVSASDKRKTYTFQLNLFGNAIKHYTTLRQAITIGLNGSAFTKTNGKKINIRNIRPQLFHEGTLTPDLSSFVKLNRIKTDDIFRDLNGFSSNIQKMKVKISSVTPIALVKNGEICAKWDTKCFFNSLFRRIKIITRLYSGSVNHYREQHNVIDDINIESDKYIPFQTIRYSHRQKQEIPLYGITGSVILTGKLSTLLPILCIGELTGVGKHTTHGMGAFKFKKIKK